MTWKDDEWVYPTIGTEGLHDDLRLAVEWLTKTLWTIGHAPGPALAEDCEAVKRAIEMIKALPDLLSKLAALRPRTLGVDGPPTEWPVIVLLPAIDGSTVPIVALGIGPNPAHPDEVGWDEGSGFTIAVPTDRYIHLSALLELGHD